MFLSMDGIIKERFDELHVLARKYSYLIPCNLQNEAFEHQITYCFDIDKEQFNMERKRIQVFMAVPSLHYKKRH